MNEPSSAAPELERGTLENGFGYAFLPLKIEPGRVSLRLIVRAGSLDERDDELGYAHFVEHMAFNGTRHYPPGKLVPFFQRMGLAWGADTNAETAVTSTVYRVDLPAAHADRLPDLLQVFADFAGGVTFDPAEVRRERGVVLSELKARDSDEWQVRKQLISVLYPDSPMSRRLPVGTPESVQHADEAGLRRFYERCYRAERMVLIVAGDFDPAALKPLVAEKFGALRGQGPLASPVRPVPMPAPKLSPGVVIDPLATAVTLSLIAIVPDEGDTAAGVELRLRREVVMRALDRRLKERRETMPNDIGQAYASTNAGLDGLYRHYGAAAQTRSDKGSMALALIESELRRAREQGFAPEEIREAASSVLANLRAAATTFPGGRRLDQVANDVAATVAKNGDWHPAAFFLPMAERGLATFSPDDARFVVTSMFAEEQLHLLFTGAKAPEGGPAALLAAYRTSAGAALTAGPAPAAELAFRYDDLGAPGKIATRDTDAALRLERVRFENGVRVNVRPSATEPARFRLRARLGRGTPDVPREQPEMTLLGGALMSQGDLGRHTRQEFSRIVRLHAIDAEWSYDLNDLTIQMAGPSAELPFALKMIAAYLSDVKLEAAKWRNAQEWYLAMRRGMLNSTVTFAKMDAIYRAGGDDPRLFLPPEPGKGTFEQVSAWVRSRWLEGPLEIGIAGDVKADEAIAAAAASVGTVGPRHESPITAAEQLTFLRKRFRNICTIDLPDKTAAVRFFWPFTDGADLRTYRALQMAEAAFQDRLRVKIREELGATYSPSGSVYRVPWQRDFGMVVIDLTLDPASTRRFIERLIKLSDDFARHGLTKEEFARAREPLRAAAAADLTSNEWWLVNVLTYAQSAPSVLDEARTHGTAFDDLTRADVNRAAAAHFGQANVNCTAFTPQQLKVER